MKPLVKISLAAGVAGLLMAAEVDPLTFIILYVLAIIFIQLNDVFDHLRDRRPNDAWRSRYSRRRSQ